MDSSQKGIKKGAAVTVKQAKQKQQQTPKKRTSTPLEDSTLVALIKERESAMEQAMAKFAMEARPICPYCNQQAFKIRQIMFRTANDKCNGCDKRVCSGCLAGGDISPFAGQRREVKTHIANCPHLKMTWVTKRLSFVTEQGAKRAWRR